MSFLQREKKNERKTDYGKMTGSPYGMATCKSNMAGTGLSHNGTRAEENKVLWVPSAPPI